MFWSLLSENLGHFTGISDDPGAEKPDTGFFCNYQLYADRTVCSAVLVTGKSDALPAFRFGTVQVGFHLIGQQPNDVPGPRIVQVLKTKLQRRDTRSFGKLIHEGLDGGDVGEGAQCAQS